MPEIKEDMLDFLDRAAYNRPDTVPRDVTRNDKAPYRMYFRFMSALYALLKSGAMSAEALKAMKRDFVSDLMIYKTIFDANAKGEREFRRLNNALADCRRNGDNCPLCKAVGNVRGAVTKADEPDVLADGQEAENGI